VYSTDNESMRIGIISDTHDHLHFLQPALAHLAGETEVLLHCGDLCSPFVMDQLAKYPAPVHIVFGNNDADLFRITRKSSDRVQVHGELLQIELDGVRFAMNHYDNIAQPLARSGMFDVVCYGHNHRFSLTTHDGALALNPGTLMGAAFGPGGWERVPPTFAIFDTKSRKVQLMRIAEDETCLPHSF
jgi:putative phosphoesterase